MIHEVAAEDVAEMLREVLPAGSPRCEIAAVGAIAREEHIFAVLHLIAWEVDEGTGARSVTDIKEQEVLFVPLHCRDSRARVAAFVRAWAAVLTEALGALESPEAVAALMPHDLVHSSALKLARAETEEDFRKALRARSRLGKLLGASSSAGAARRVEEG